MNHAPVQIASLPAPRTVKTAIALQIASLGVGLLDLLLIQAGLSEAQLSSSSFFGFAIGAAFTAVFLVFILLRHNWARWVVAILTGLVALFAIPVVLMEIPTDPIGAASTLVQAAMQVASVVMLFSTSASSWFRAKLGNGG